MALSMLTTWKLAVTPEPVTLLSRTGDAAFADVPVPHAKRRALLGTQEDQHGVKEMTWHLWLDGVAGGVRPKREDRITDAQGVAWVVHEVSTEGNGVRHRCSTRRVL